MKYPDLEWGVMEAAVNKLGGMEGVRRFLAGESSLVEASEFFRPLWEEIRIPALPRPTLEELREKFPWVTRIESDTSPIDEVTFVLGTVLRPKEGFIDGAEYKRRRVLLLGRMFGYQQFVWFVDHQDEHPAFKALIGLVYIDGPGIVVVHADGGRLFSCLREFGRRWYLDWRWAEGGLRRGGRVAVSGK